MLIRNTVEIPLRNASNCFLKTILLGWAQRCGAVLF
jgi:hypothetical protein